jgi:Ser/Thr protein kinase RdoA (MazF antagonist)
VELLAEGRPAEVFVIDDERVVKLDRPEWNGVSAFESDVITRVAEAGLPVARSHGVITIDGRCGVLLDRLYGRPLLQVVIESAQTDIHALAEQFAALQAMINATVIESLPDLVGRLTGEIDQSGLRSKLVEELIELLVQLDDGTRCVCHYDLHPDNVIVTAAGWVVIDWLGVASGPPVADLARTLLLGSRIADPRVSEFMRAVRRHGLRQCGKDEAACDAWIRLAAAARLAEGFSGESVAWLRTVAEGAVVLY